MTSAKARRQKCPLNGTGRRWGAGAAFQGADTRIRAARRIDDKTRIRGSCFSSNAGRGRWRPEQDAIKNRIEADILVSGGIMP
jgi:hypothetical protein